MMLHKGMMLHETCINILLYINEHVRELLVFSRVPDHCARLVTMKVNICSARSLLVKIRAQLLGSARQPYRGPFSLEVMILACCWGRDLAGKV